MDAVKSSVRYLGVHLEEVFDSCFGHSETTRLSGGSAEPSYKPAAQGRAKHLLSYREDYFASALHEVAHWCIAGAQRRTLEDFGYWYAPEGRTISQQRHFETVEVKPQALEWFFSRACGFPFRMSLDNLNPDSGELPDTSFFCEALLLQVTYWQQQGLPPRGEQFYRALCLRFGTKTPSRQLLFSAQELR